MWKTLRRSFRVLTWMLELGDDLMECMILILFNYLDLGLGVVGRWRSLIFLSLHSRWS